MYCKSQLISRCSFSRQSYQSQLWLNQNRKKIAKLFHYDSSSKEEPISNIALKQSFFWKKNVPLRKKHKSTFRGNRAWVLWHINTPKILVKLVSIQSDNIWNRTLPSCHQITSWNMIFEYWDLEKRHTCFFLWGNCVLKLQKITARRRLL